MAPQSSIGFFGLSPQYYDYVVPRYATRGSVAADAGPCPGDYLPPAGSTCDFNAVFYDAIEANLSTPYEYFASPDRSFNCRPRDWLMGMTASGGGVWRPEQILMGVRSNLTLPNSAAGAWNAGNDPALQGLENEGVYGYQTAVWEVVSAGAGGVLIDSLESYFDLKTGFSNSPVSYQCSWA
jgi:hypothetical protein